MMRNKHFWIIVTLAMLLLTVGGVAGDGYTLFSTLDGGGGNSSSVSGYLLRGTAGQPDHITLSGGTYALYAGFWPPDSAAFPVPTAVSVLHTTAQAPAAWLALLLLAASGGTLLWLRRQH